MEKGRKKLSVLTLILVVVLLICLCALVFVCCRPIDSGTPSCGASGLYSDSVASIDIGQLTDQERFKSLTEDNTILFPKYETPVTLAMADGPGKPTSTEIKPNPTLTEITGSSESSPQTQETAASSECVSQESSTEVPQGTAANANSVLLSSTTFRMSVQLPGSRV